MYREILTKAIIAKGHKKFYETKLIETNQQISKILGCWIINHNFDIKRVDQNIFVNGSYEVYYWFGYDNNTKSKLVNETYYFEDEIPYSYTLERILLDDKSEIKSLEIIDPLCSKMEYDNTSISINVEREYKLDIIGETKIKIKVDEILINEEINTDYLNNEKSK